jgi:SAM-dependent methyltransferase
MNAPSNDMTAYYAQRANEYEEIYEKPERQEELAILHKRVQDMLNDQHVLEIACGTGYWTAQFAHSAASVVATDINQEMIDIAKAKALPSDKVEFALTDAHDLQIDKKFTASFLGFWWSHVKRQDQTEFMEKLRARLDRNALVVMIDNTYVEGDSTPVARTDLEGNTFQIRTLANGERYEILKNFPTDSALRKKLAAVLKDIRILRLEHFWMLTGRMK